MKLPPKQQAFVREYLVDLNASAAYRRAGYTSGNADVCGPRLLGKVRIQAAVQSAMDKRAKRVELKADRVLQEIAHAAFLDPLELFKADGTLKALPDMPEAARRAIAGLEVEEIFQGTGAKRKWVGYLKKIKLVSKEGTLQLAGRHLKLFTDKAELTGPGGGPIQVAHVDLTGWLSADLEQLAALLAKYAPKAAEEPA